ncbi:alpha/beta fold hydrolase [Larkinella terrae]|uniref:Alpha/beta fold hydrolase n=1 Tax=Larkinella terrae TaxID=2025311 RepID=A0A7K0ELU7_9BACT|nr:alpha/beta hydrolase [Larkinella terrae]MRS62501.1 alpha/beta fold hydrolase [Larkinella terrae]
MKLFLRILRWALIVIVVVFAGLLTAAHWVESRDSDEEIAESFQNERVKAVVHRYKIADRTIRYMETDEPGKDSLPVVLFVHGAPSSSAFFKKFFKDTTLVNHAHLVAVDRPGYGYSDYGRVETSIVKQAQLLQPLMDHYRKASFFMLVGSSYGGSVAARLAMNNPDLVDQVVFVSSALGPGLERTYPISYFIDKPPLRWLVPRLLLLANDEKLAHRQALTEIMPDWNKIKAGVTFLHGQRDDLVYPTNVAFGRTHLINAQSREYLLPENRHDIVFNKREYMTQIIVNILNAYADSVKLRKSTPRILMTANH